MNVSGKTVLITGAARGLGAAMARRLARDGAALALADLDAAELDPVVAECAAAGASASAYAADVSREADVVELYERVAADFGSLDASIANAGIVRDGRLVKTENGRVAGKLALEDWQAVVDVNLTGVFLCGREAAARMIELGREGCIVNISSIARAGNFGQTNYSAAKAGVAAMTVVWAKELAKSRIRVNAIAPGFIETEILAGMPENVKRKMLAMIPAGRPGRPEEVADAAAFVIGNDYVNGRVVELDGGLRI